jgi:hypothetical protein
MARIVEAIGLYRSGKVTREADGIRSISLSLASQTNASCTRRPTTAAAR